jgi:hypothetical protein
MTHLPEIRDPKRLLPREHLEQPVLIKPQMIKADH